MSNTDEDKLKDILHNVLALFRLKNGLSKEKLIELLKEWEKTL